MLAYLHGHSAAHKYTRASRVLLASAPTFDPFVGEIYTALVTGGKLVLATLPHLYASLSSIIVEGSVTHVQTTPTLWKTMDTNCDTNLSVVMLGGEPMSTSIIASWANKVELWNVYGVTEATVYQLHARMDATKPLAYCLGLPFVDVSTQLHPDADGSNLLQLSGNVLGRYLDSSSPGFYLREGGLRYNTGDVVQAIEGGFLYKGRKDNQVRLLKTAWLPCS
jgi:non-ribosomal peptide synthetase component F